MALASGNTGISLLASAARTATTSTAAQPGDYQRGVLVVLKITAASGTGGLQTQVEVQDAVTGDWVALNTAPTAVTATGTKTYLVYPGATGGAVTQATSLPVGGTWRVTVTAGDSSSYTYSVAAVRLT